MLVMKLLENRLFFDIIVWSIKNLFEFLMLRSTISKNPVNLG